MSSFPGTDVLTAMFMWYILLPLASLRRLAPLQQIAGAATRCWFCPTGHSHGRSTISNEVLPTSRLFSKPSACLPHTLVKVICAPTHCLLGRGKVTSGRALPHMDVQWQLGLLCPSCISLSTSTPCPREIPGYLSGLSEGVVRERARPWQFRVPPVFLVFQPLPASQQPRNSSILPSPAVDDAFRDRPGLKSLLRDKLGSPDIDVRILWVLASSKI